MGGDKLTTDVQKCAGPVGILYSYKIQVCLHKRKAVVAVQERIYSPKKASCVEMFPGVLKM